MSKIKTGDKIIVLSGQYKGVKGEVVSVIVKHNKAIVKGINCKNIGVNIQNIQENPIYLCKIALMDPISGKPTRVGFKFKHEIKYRIAIRSNTKLKNNLK